MDVPHDGVTTCRDYVSDTLRDAGPIIPYLSHYDLTMTSEVSFYRVVAYVMGKQHTPETARSIYNGDTVRVLASTSTPNSHGTTHSWHVHTTFTVEHFDPKHIQSGLARELILARDCLLISSKRRV